MKVPSPSGSEAVCFAESVSPTVFLPMIVNSALPSFTAPGAGICTASEYHRCHFLESLSVVMVSVLS